MSADSDRLSAAVRIAREYVETWCHLGHPGMRWNRIASGHQAEFIDVVEDMLARGVIIAPEGDHCGDDTDSADEISHDGSAAAAEIHVHVHLDSRAIAQAVRADDLRRANRNPSSRQWRSG